MHAIRAIEVLRYTPVLTHRYNRQLIPVENYSGYHPVPGDTLYSCTTCHVESRVQFLETMLSVVQNILGVTFLVFLPVGQRRHAAKSWPT
jgi:hypothetical protein